MSTKTTIKRLALVTVAALGLGVLSVAPSQAAPAGDTLALSATTASTTSGTAATVTVTQSFLAESGDTMTVTASLIQFPAGNTVQPAWSSISAVSTDLGSANVDTATARVAKIGSVTGFVNKSLTLSFNGTVAGTYVIRVTPAISHPSSLTPVATYKDWTVTVAAKTVGWTSAFIGAYTNGTSDTATADAVLTPVATSSVTPRARIDVGQGYGTTSGSDTATAADAGAVVVTTDKGLVAKSTDYTTAAKTVTEAAAGDPDADFYVFSNGDVGKASITITVGGVLKSTKTISFTGAATAIVATLTTGQPAFAPVAGTTTYDITATDTSGGAATALPTGMTVKSSDTSVATVAITGNNLVTVTGVAAGTATITVTDPATSAAATAATFVATVAAVRPTAAPTITFDKTSYEVGSLVTMTVSAAMADSATAQLFTSTGIVLSATVVPSGTAIPTNGQHAIVAGVATYKFYAPAVSGTLAYTATTGGAVNITTAATVAGSIAITNASTDAATAAAELAEAAAQDATDAALDATEAATLAGALAQEAVDAVADLSAEVAKLISALKDQITKLTNLVIKIQKKVKA
jgi:hypothetical protein